MYLAYIDDSEFTAAKNQQKPAQQLKEQPEQFQVLCAVLIKDSSFILFEQQFSKFGFMVYPSIMTDDLPLDFEFHAFDLFHGIGIFEKPGQQKCFEIFERCMKEVAAAKLPVVYGAVDKANLATKIYRSTNPLDVSFRLCIERVQEWLRKNNAPGELGLIITDKFDNGKNRTLKKIFRQYRQKALPWMRDAIRDAMEAKANQSPTTSVELPNLIDDMYSGDSADSVGIQAADMCGFLIRRHLAGKQDSEWLYKIIEPNIVGSVWPE